jgi:hypothetical protein
MQPPPVGGVDANGKANITVITGRSALCAMRYRYWCKQNFQYSATTKVRLLPGGEAVVNPGCLSASDSYPHSDSLFPGRLGLSDPNRGWLSNVNDVITVGMVNSELQTWGNKRVIMKRQIGREWVYVVEGLLAYDAGKPPTAVITFSYESTYLGYTSISVADLMAPIQAVPYDQTVELNLNLNGATVPRMAWGQLPLPYMTTMFGVVDRLRVLAQSTCMTNTTATVARQGEIVGVQLDPDTEWTANSDYSTLASLASAKTLDASNGMYGFLRPAAATDLDFFTEFDSVAVNNPGLSEVPELSDAAFSIIPDKPYMALSYSFSNAQAISGLFTVQYSVEFLTKNQWIDRAMPTHSLNQLVLAAQAIAVMEQFHENPWHLEEIGASIKKFVSDVADGVIKYAPMAIEAARFLAPLLL